MRSGLTFLCQVRKVRAPEDSVMGNAHLRHQSLADGLSLGADLKERAPRDPEETLRREATFGRATETRPRCFVKRRKTAGE
jgi:hypothetical protein